MRCKEQQIKDCHDVDREATAAMQALGRMLQPAFDLGLLAELRDVRDALNALHMAATVKYNALTGKVPN
jgi:hypothetical protein